MSLLPLGELGLTLRRGHGIRIMRAGIAAQSSIIRQFRGVLLGTVTVGSADSVAAEETTASLLATASQPIALIVVAALVLVLAGCTVFVRKYARDARRARQQVEEAEARLNEAEAVLTAEPCVLVVWSGRGAEPSRVAGDMRGTAKVPSSREDLLDLQKWLETESAVALGEAITAMRAHGTVFNIAVRTSAGELLEADGRTAGGLATLRLRPLAGERRSAAELAYDARKLGKQVERLSAVLDSAPLPVWLRNPDGSLLWVNRAYIKAVEVNGIESVIAGQIEIVDPARQVATSDGTGTLSGRGHTVIGGAKRAFDLHEVQLTEGTAGFAVDATALEDAERELKRHIEAHANTLDRLGTAIAIFGPDQRLRFFNAAYVELWQLDPDWLKTAPLDGEILDRLRELRRLPEEANYRDWRERQLQAYTTLETRQNWWYLPDGRALHVVCEQHPFGGVTYVYENATKEMQLESHIKSLTETRRETLDNLAEGVAVFGTDGCIVLHNPAFARFWQLDADFLNAVPAPHVDRIVEKCRKLFDDGSIWDDLKYAITGLDTGRKPISGRIEREDMVLDYSTVPLPDGSTLLSCVDVTAPTRMEHALRERAEALEAADRLKTGFMSNVSYELRTPLTNIIGFGESLTLGIAGELLPKQAEYLRDIQTSSQDLLAIIDAILDLTTIDAGAMELRLKEIDVPAMMEEVASAAANFMAKRNLTLSIEVADDAVSFIGDEKRIAQVLRQLMTNAMGFSPEGGAISMGSKAEGDHILLWVADNGRGIAPELQKRVFDRFHSMPLPGGHRGPGLGLAIVKSFVELHDGQVSLISRINKGTTVICRLPVTGPKSGGKPPSPRAVA